MKDALVPLRVTYDAEANAAYFYFVEDAEPGGVAKMVPFDPSNGAMVNLDMDADGRILGLEVLDARTLLPSKLLSEIDHR